MLNLHAREAPEALFVADEVVDVAPLDDLIGTQVDTATRTFIKVDVQGFELHVLLGGAGMLARSTLVQIEMSLFPVYESAPTYRDILEHMERQGFGLVGIEPGFAARTGLLLQMDGLFASRDAVAILREARP